ncbi:MAG TPA: DoxX family membrane protein [Gaiellaceae bacterium]|nr:DoxX family membrane protein [Gaiellaceae bacterium]
MNVALLVLRIVVGALFVGHGAQKLFGWFRGAGPRQTASFFESVGFAPALPLAILAGLAELVGGALLAFGLFVPAAAALLIAVMTAATVAVHWAHGLWNQDGGFEYPLVLATAAFTVAALGPGTISLDNAFGIAWSGLGWAVAALLVGLVAGLGAWALRRFARVRRPEEQLARAA